MTFDSNYLAKAIVAYESLMRFRKDFILYAYCFDDLSYETMKNLKATNIIAVSYTDFETEKLKMLRFKAYLRMSFDYLFLLNILFLCFAILFAFLTQ